MSNPFRVIQARHSHGAKQAVIQEQKVNRREKIIGDVLRILDLYLEYRKEDGNPNIASEMFTLGQVQKILTALEVGRELKALEITANWIKNGEVARGSHAGHFIRTPKVW